MRKSRRGRSSGAQPARVLSRRPLAVGYFAAAASFAGGVALSFTGSPTPGTLVMVGALVLGCTNVIIQRLFHIEDDLRSIPPLDLVSAARRTALGDLLVDRALARYTSSLRALSQGRVAVENQFELQQAYLDAAKQARHSIDAVDNVGLDVWLSSPQLSAFLDLQRGLVASGVRIRRIRLVDRRQMSDNAYAARLRRYTHAQELAGVQLRLCYSERLTPIGLIPAGKGWMVVDSEFPDRICGTTSILASGEMKEGALHIGDSPETQKLQRDFDQLLQSIAEFGWDRDVWDAIGDENASASVETTGAN